jgi:hypothetical protein
MRSIVIGFFVVSFAINLLGAWHSAMLCDFLHWAAGRYLSEMRHDGVGSFPLAPWLLVPFLICLALLVWTLSPSCPRQTSNCEMMGR